MIALLSSLFIKGALLPGVAFNLYIHVSLKLLKKILLIWGMSYEISPWITSRSNSYTSVFSLKLRPICYSFWREPYKCKPKYPKYCDYYLMPVTQSSFTNGRSWTQSGLLLSKTSKRVLFFFLKQVLCWSKHVRANVSQIKKMIFQITFRI